MTMIYAIQWMRSLRFYLQSDDCLNRIFKFLLTVNIEKKFWQVSKKFDLSQTLLHRSWRDLDSMGFCM